MNIWLNSVIERNRTLTQKNLLIEVNRTLVEFDWDRWSKLACIRLKWDVIQENWACFAECFLFLSRLYHDWVYSGSVVVDQWSVFSGAKKYTRTPGWANRLQRLSLTRALECFFSLWLKPKFSWRSINCFHGFLTCSDREGARSIQPKFPEISVQNSMDRFGPTGKVSKKVDHFSRSDRLQFWLNGSRPRFPRRWMKNGEKVPG